MVLSSFGLHRREGNNGANPLRVNYHLTTFAGYRFPISGSSSDLVLGVLFENDPSASDWPHEAQGLFIHGEESAANGVVPGAHEDLVGCFFRSVMAEHGVASHVDGNLGGSEFASKEEGVFWGFKVRASFSPSRQRAQVTCAERSST